MPDNRKIYKIHDNPIDNVIIDIAHWMNVNVFTYLHFTPNILTTISLLFGIISPIFFYKKQYTLASVCFLLSYFFDCADGDYARTYDMVTEFGDYYDHVSDIVKFILLLIVIIFHKIDVKWKIMFVVIFISLGILSCIHLGCQEKIYDPEANDILSKLIPICNNEKNIVWTRYFGVGTNMMFVTLFLFFIRYKSKK